MRAKVRLENLVARLIELKKEQSEYAESISNLTDDRGRDNIVVKALRDVKTIVDKKIARLEGLTIVVETDNADTLEGVVGVRLEGDDVLD